jgi:hypothetical protein
MANVLMTFTDMEGGYPHAINNNNTAITDDGLTFYLDVGKTAAYGDIQFLQTEPLDSTIPGTITGIEIIIEAAGTDSTSNTTFDAELYHPVDEEYTSVITTTVTANTNPSTDNISIGGPTNLWGKTWTQANLEDENFRLHLYNGDEPAGGICLIGDWVYMKIHYTEGNGKIILDSGKIILEQGKITL